jgi:hypothetical protein
LWGVSLHTHTHTHTHTHIHTHLPNDTRDVVGSAKVSVLADCMLLKSPTTDEVRSSSSTNTWSMVWRAVRQHVTVPGSTHAWGTCTVGRRVTGRFVGNTVGSDEG